MPRNPSGSYSLPAGNPVTQGTTISETWANDTLSDIADALTNSLSRDGEGAMAGPLKLADGEVTAPALAFENDADTGLYMPSVGNLAAATAGEDRQTWGAAGSQLSVPLSLPGADKGSPSLFFTDSGRGFYETTEGHPGVASDGDEIAAFAPAGTILRKLTTLVGDAHLTGSNPAATDAFANTLTRMNLPKAWGLIITTGAGSATLVAGFNVASISVDSTQLTVTLASPMASTEYAVLPTDFNGGSGDYAHWTAVGGGMTETVFRLRPFDSAFADINPSTTVVGVAFVVFGAQP